MKKRIISFLLVLVFCGMAVLPACPVSAAETDNTTDFAGITDPGVPRNFNNANVQDPYGYGKGVPFLLTEQNELFFMHNYNGSSTVAVKDTLGSQSFNTGRVLNAFGKTSYQPTNDTVRGMSFSKAVSFDPTGSGRRDHVAVVGVSGYILYIVFYNLRTQTWSYSYPICSMTWLSNSSAFYQMGEFISVTAGDYDGDGKDTVVVYGALSEGYGILGLSTYYGYGIYEIAMNPVGSYPAAVVKTNADRSLLNPAYNTAYADPDFVDTDDDEGCDRLACVLATGDINGDGIDDLAALSHGLGDEYDYDVNYVVPYLSVKLGKKGASGLFGQNTGAKYGEYIRGEGKKYDSNESVFTTFRAEGMTFVNTDTKRGDDIVIAGEKVTYYYYTDNGEFSDYDEGGASMETAKYSWLNGTLTRVFYTDQYRDGNSTGYLYENGFTEWGIEGVGDGTPQVAVQGVYMNGKGNPAYVMIGGDLFDCSEPTMPKKVFDFAYLNSADKGVGGASININFISSAVSGNFDGNGEGYEQIVMALARKQNSYDDTSFSVAMIGIDRTKRDPETGIPADLSQAFYVTTDSALETMDADDEGDDFSEALAFLLVPVDSDDDGILARYNSKDYVYSDPDVLAILQEAPFFDELDPYIADRAATSYTISETKTLTQESSNSVSFGIGGKVAAETSVMDFSVGAGYSMDWSESFAQSISYSIEQSWQAQTDDSVILYRTPWFFFNYDIYNGSTKQWEENALSIATENEPFYKQLSVRDYNDFVDYYNGLLGNRTSKKLVKVNAKTSYLSLHGNPYLYPEFAPQMYGSLQAMSYNGSATAITSTEESEMAHTTEMAHGFSFELELLFGLSVLGNGAKAGIQTNLQYLSGTSTSESTGKGISCGGMVQGVVEKDMRAAGYTDSQIHAYSFQWKLGIWDSNIPTGKADETGKTLFVPVVGYTVSNVTSPPHPISDLSVDVAYDSIRNPKGITIKWEDPSEEFEGYPKPERYNVYLVSGTTYEPVGSVPYGTNEWFFTDLQTRSNLRFAVRCAYAGGETVDTAQCACYVVYPGIVNEKGEKGDKGDKGEKGTPGAPGAGIADISLTAQNGNVDTYTVTLTDGRTYTYTVTNAPVGEGQVIYANDIEEGDYILYTAMDDTKAMEIAGGSSAKQNGGVAQLWNAQETTSKVFTLTKDTNSGSYIIRAKHSGRVLSIKDNVKQAGASIIQWDDYGNLGQRWVFEPAGNGYYYIRSVFGQLYLDVSNASTANGAWIITWNYTGGANQKFRLLKVPSSSLNTGSVLSDGNRWIVGGVAFLALGGTATLAVVKKKKKTKSEE